MSIWRAAVYAIIFIICTAYAEKSWLVQTPQGPVRGYKDSENDIYVFSGIPYATAPTGTNRFKAPEPAPKWKEPFNAVNKGIVCPQSDYLLKHFNAKGRKMSMVENCLIANVYVPDTNEKNLPVYVYVHGGGFVLGHGDFTTPKKLVNSQKIISVTFNYRLGPHGFLCLGTEAAPGNAGMKDQVALLRWVKANIASFGGNPNDVTIGGGSAGSASVDLLMLSKMAEGLFNKVIPESGASTSVFTIQFDPIVNAKAFAELLGFDNTEDLNVLEEQYKSVPYDKLFTNKVLNLTGSHFMMSPCIERDIGQEIFLDKDPVNILKSGNFKKLPMLYGFANMEGLLRLPYFDTWKDLMTENFGDFLPVDLKFDSEIEKEQVVQMTKEFYFGDKEIGQDILGFIDYISDVFFVFSTLRNVKLQVEAGNNEIYLYEFAYVNENAPAIPNTDVRGAGHCAQSMAVMDDIDIEGFTSPLSEEYENTRQLYRNVWLNFIITGKPVPDNSDLPKWPAVGANRSPHMLLNKTMELKGPLLKERTLFWEKNYNKYYRTPIPPNTQKLTHAEL